MHERSAFNDAAHASRSALCVVREAMNDCRVTRIAESTTRAEVDARMNQRFIMRLVDTGVQRVRGKAEGRFYGHGVARSSAGAVRAILSRHPYRLRLV
jgi:hypothetical protein